MKQIVIISALSALAFSANANNIKSCMGCHGPYFEKKALGKSKVVKDMSEEEIAKALDGYASGSYGGSLKDLMKGQVKQNISNPYSAAKEIKKLAKSK